MKMDISWDGHWPKQASQTEGSSSWWLPNKLSDSWSCPETVAKPADLILVRAEGVCMVKRGSITVQVVHVASRDFLEQCRAWGIYTSLFTHHRALVLWATKSPVTSSRVQMQPAADSSPWVFVWSTYIKTQILPFLLTSPVAHSIVVICGWCLRKHLWKSRGTERCKIAELQGTAARTLLKLRPKSSSLPERLDQVERAETRVFFKE